MAAKNSADDRCVYQDNKSNEHVQSNSVVRKPRRPLGTTVVKQPIRKEDNERKYSEASSDMECDSVRTPSVSSVVVSDQDDSCCSSLSSINVEMKACRYGIKCFNVGCEFTHPDGWNPCIDGSRCAIYECTNSHPFKRKEKCRYGDRCKISTCKFLHPTTRADECPLRVQCKEWDCRKTHPRSRARVCTDNENCTNLACLCLHSPRRASLICSIGAYCRDLSCRLKHPSERPPVCDQPDTCSNSNCTRIHGSDWNPCEADDKHLDDKTTKKNQKSLKQRMDDWTKTNLPILPYRSEFCQRLEDEHMLVVTAETGSGKSTQLPQYAAEHFGSLVVCTQPRVVAALSLAHRVAEEYDGTSIGESVGYQVGHANRVVGSSIMFMTDSAFIRESQQDPDLTRVRVLIIDEAHERSLNTDIILGIAKLLLMRRSKNFYVVIASATIDPTRFLQYFDRPTSIPFEVKGRVFPVTVENKSSPSDCSDQKLLETHIVSSIVELYPRHEGHILVFLPGQGEIERALKIFKSNIPDNCIALPLYGSQSREDQEKVIRFNEKNKRMVVFCTNVAETSLTIPNVRLVIDSGWAKEARYDTKRRLTVIETVRISRSSADQRKGRAGRTAPGHCVRLYDDTELKRLNIEPEILRSSLDLVLLQLIRLKLDPKTFPFMDQPDIDIITNSIDLLTRLKCIDNQTITKRGELFTELGLDPRFSAFIVDIYTEYQSLLELAAGIVSIISAPGTIFFMGGATQEVKDEAKMKIAVQAQNYDSDLIHLYLVYDAWKNAGTKQTAGRCSKCLKQIKWCICRIKHSNEHGLNNKILQNINSTSISIMKQIKNATWLTSGNEMPEKPTEIISKYLAQLFPEQCGYLLVPQLPTEGVRLVSTDVRANITNTSVFMQKLHTDSNNELYQHFIAMTITQLSSGRYIIERLHPIPRSLATVQISVNNLYVVENISSKVFHCIRRKLNTYRAEQWAKWIVYQYDRPHCRCIVWGFESERSQIVPIVQQTYDEVVKIFYNDSQLYECEPIQANLQSGLICTHINKVPNALRLDLKNIPNLKFDDLMNWLQEVIGIDRNDFARYDYRNSNLRLVFKHEDTYRRAKMKTPVYYLNEQDNEYGFRRDNEKDSWGRQLTIETPIDITVQHIIQRYGVHLITNCIQLNKQNGRERIESSLKLNNLHKDCDEGSLRQCLQECNGPQPKHIIIGRSKNNLTGWAKVIFNDVQQRNQAATIYDLKLCHNISPINVIGKRGSKLKFIRTTVENDNRNVIPKNRFLVTIINREEARKIYFSYKRTNINQSWTVDGSATVTVAQTDLYPNCQDIINHISNTYHVKVIPKNLPNNSKRFTFTNGNPQTTSSAASMFAKYFTPMNIQLNTERQKQLFKELDEIGELKNWTSELKLDIQTNQSKTRIKIQGPQIAQGELMRRIADYSDKFNPRFREYDLNSTLAAFFGPQKAAFNKLQEIHSQWSAKLCSVSFIPRTSSIIIIGKPDVLLDDINACKKEVFQLLNELTGTTNNDESEEEEDDDDDKDENRIVQEDRSCVFCKQNSSISTNLFRICGHAYCRCTAQYLSTSTSFPLQCKYCQSNIHICDIQIIFNDDKQLFMHLLKNSIQNYLINNVQEDDRVFCPNYECNGLIKWNLGYQTCFICGQSVCSKCRIINDESHTNKTCDDLTEGKKRLEFFPELFRAAKKFVDDNWPIDFQMRPIGRVDENPYLEKRYKSLKRFYRGLKILGHSLPPVLSKGFFAYHGTTPQAVVPICEHGFDPKRRSGQVHGRGEYFGITAGVSHGYTQKQGSQVGTHQMIITFILRCPQLTLKENFCYIVDNPIDWKYAFNLPVLIVTYGPSTIALPSPFTNSIPEFVDDDDDAVDDNDNNDNGDLSHWHAPFRWYWRRDDNQFELYIDTCNRILEKSYDQWKLYAGPATIILPMNINSQVYQIDFKNNRQMNMETRYPRKIERRLLDTSTEKKKWFYQDEYNNWVQYDSAIEILIEKAFQSYRLGQGPSAADIQVPNHHSIYKINFLLGRQIDKMTCTIKHIKYEQKCPEPVKTNEVVKFFRSFGQTVSKIFQPKKSS